MIWKIIYVLNLFDLACTLYALSIGATELNPLMRCVPVLVVYKLVVVGALLWWLSTRRERAARYALYVAAAVYGAVDVYHMINILRRRETWTKPLTICLRRKL